MATIAVGWVISSGCSPIVGVSSIERLEDAIAVSDFKFTEDKFNYLQEIYKLKVLIIDTLIDI